MDQRLCAFPLLDKCSVNHFHCDVIRIRIKPVEAALRCREHALRVDCVRELTGEPCTLTRFCPVNTVFQTGARVCELLIQFALQEPMFDRAAKFLLSHRNRFFPGLWCRGQVHARDLCNIKEILVARATTQEWRIFLARKLGKPARQDAVTERLDQILAALLGCIRLFGIGFDIIDRNRCRHIWVIKEIGLQPAIGLYNSKIRIAAFIADTLPIAERFFQLRFDLGRFEITDHHKGHALRAIVFVVDIDEALARRGRDHVQIPNRQTICQNCVRGQEFQLIDEVAQTICIAHALFRFDNAPLLINRFGVQQQIASRLAHNEDTGIDHLFVD